MFWVTSYYVKTDKYEAYLEWLRSEEAKQIYAALEEETGMRFIDV